MVKQSLVPSAVSFTRSSVVLSCAVVKNLVLEAEVSSYWHHILVLLRQLDHAMKEVAILTVSLKAVSTTVISPSTTPSPVTVLGGGLDSQDSLELVEGFTHLERAAGVVWSVLCMTWLRTTALPGVAELMAEGGMGTSSGAVDIVVGRGSAMSTVDHPQPVSGNRRRNKKRHVVFTSPAVVIMELEAELFGTGYPWCKEALCAMAQESRGVKCASDLSSRHIVLAYD
ncbi:hypothetical protein HOY80DRAFT_1092886 [Tuber brumale]|nr:hypothetical protein HOY80DRAFT_1092886 [Tuber brumale]